MRVDCPYHLLDLFPGCMPRSMRLYETYAEVLEPVMQPFIVYQHLLVERFTERMYERASGLRLDVDELSHVVKARVRHKLSLVLAHLLSVPGVGIGQKLPFVLVVIATLIPATSPLRNHDDDF